MSEARFTPGPWVAVCVEPKVSRAFLHGEPPIHENGVWWILPKADYERLPIATIDKANDSHAPTREHAEIDARLIAAAPDLLDALREAVWYLTPETPLLNRVEAAIRKATEAPNANR